MESTAQGFLMAASVRRAEDPPLGRFTGHQETEPYLLRMSLHYPDISSIARRFNGSLDCQIRRKRLLLLNA